MRKAGMNMAQVKKQNRSSILNCVNECEPVSRKDIADLIGLTPAAVTQICSELIQEGVLEEQGFETQSVRAGRKKVLLNLNYNCFYVITVNILCPAHRRDGQLSDHQEWRGRFPV